MHCYFDQLVFRSEVGDASEPSVTDVVEISKDQGFATVPGVDPFPAGRLDQDTDIMRRQREGMYASKTGAGTLARDQEARIRHLHETPDYCLNHQQARRRPVRLGRE